MSGLPDAVHGRGSADNPPNRFERLHYEVEPDDDGAEPGSPKTQFLRDSSRSIIATNESPDVGFGASINPYRGCEHGCAYCYARPTHEYLGFSAGLDFETKILVKEEAPNLLRRELSARKWQPEVLGISGVTDPYQPIERRLELTRRCLEVLAEFHNPVAVITKNHLVTRDADVLAKLAQDQAAVVFLSITSLDGELSRTLEPRASQPSGRLAAIEALTRAGVPAGVMVAPIIPGLTDHEMPGILAAAAQAGARFAGYTLVRLPLTVAPVFEQWLTRYAPEKKEKVLSRLREMRDGKLNDPRFGSRMRGEGPIARTIKDLFELSRKRAGIGSDGPKLASANFQIPGAKQRLLFD